MFRNMKSRTVFLRVEPITSPEKREKQQDVAITLQSGPESHNFGTMKCQKSTYRKSLGLIKPTLRRGELCVALGFHPFG